jgi:hypothetical protein
MTTLGEYEERRLARIEADLAKLELQRREQEFLDVRAKFSLALAFHDSKAHNQLLPRMREIWQLEAKAAGAAPCNLGEISDAEATRRARTILAELGHKPCGATHAHQPDQAASQMREPDLHDPRSRGVAVGAGSAESTFRRGAANETITEQEATERAAKILQELGHEPNRAS